MFPVRAILILIALLFGLDSATQSVTATQAVTATQSDPDVSFEIQTTGFDGQLGMSSTRRFTVERATREQQARIDGEINPNDEQSTEVGVVTVERASPEQRARVDEAAQRFADQGLELPSVVVEFAVDNPEECSGHLGLFRHDSSTLRLTICSDFDFVVTHEFAHAWIDVNLDEQSRRHYTDVRGLGSWTDAETEWKDRGVENAAFVIQQNLMLIGAATLTPAVFDRISAYEFLTGLRSPLRPAV